MGWPQGCRRRRGSARRGGVARGAARVRDVAGAADQAGFDPEGDRPGGRQHGGSVQRLRGLLRVGRGARIPVPHQQPEEPDVQYDCRWGGGDLHAHHESAQHDLASPPGLCVGQVRELLFDERGNRRCRHQGRDGHRAVQLHGQVRCRRQPDLPVRRERRLPARSGPVGGLERKPDVALQHQQPDVLLRPLRLRGGHGLSGREPERDAERG